MAHGKYCVVVELLGCVRLFCNAMDYIARQAPLSMVFPRQENYSGLPFSSPGDLPNPGFERMSPALVGGFSITDPPGKPGKYYMLGYFYYFPKVVGKGKPC